MFIFVVTKEVLIFVVKIIPGGGLFVLIVSEDTFDPILMEGIVYLFGSVIRPLSELSAKRLGGQSISWQFV